MRRIPPVIQWMMRRTTWPVRMIEIRKMVSQRRMWRVCV